MPSQLTISERELISQMRYAAQNNAAIARRLKRHWSTAGRELNRNASAGGYYAVAAEGLARTRRFSRWHGRRNKRRRIRKPSSFASESIAGRPAVVDRRSRYGDWEGDTIVGARQRGALVTTGERKSGFLLASRIANRQVLIVNRSRSERQRRISISINR